MRFSTICAVACTVLTVYSLNNQQPLYDLAEKCDHKNYQSYDDSVDCLRSLIARYPDRAELVDIGQSYENRSTYGIRIHGSKKGRSLALITAGMEARDWIGPAVAKFIAQSLIESTQMGILEVADIYIVPFVNPDGYEYTQTTDRNWAKTRSINRESSCRGASMYRNFPFRFGDEGTSSHPCSIAYKGSLPLSEIEAANLDNYFKPLASNMTFFIDLRAFGQLLLFPWGYTAGALSDNSEYLEAALGRWAAASNYTWEVGGAADVLYGIGGQPLDYFHALGVQNAVEVALPDTGDSGYFLPESEIIPVAKDVLKGLQGFILESK